MDVRERGSPKKQRRRRPPVRQRRGPMGRTVQDVALLSGTQAGQDQCITFFIANYVDYTRTTGIFYCKNTRIGCLGDLSGHLSMHRQAAGRF